MLLESDRLGRHFCVIPQIRFYRFRGGCAKRRFTDLLSADTAWQMVIIKARFADCDDFRMLCQLPELGEEIFSFFACGGWMDSDDRIDLRMLLRKPDRRPA